MTPLTRRDTPAVGAPLHTHVTHQVQLTWDETDHERVTAMNRKFNKDELLDMDFRAYLASSSEEEEREEEAESRQESRGEQSRGSCYRGNRLLTRFVSAAGEATKEKKEEQTCKYRELLRGIQEKEKKLQEDKDMEMEVTWVPGTGTPGPQPHTWVTA